MHRSSPPPASGSSPTAPAAVVPPAAPTSTTPSAAALAAAHGSTAVGSSATTPTPRRYHTRVGPTSLSLPHPRPSWRAPPTKRARTSGPGESSSSRLQEPQSPPHQGLVGAPPLDLSPASIIWRPLFHYNPIPENVDYSEKDLHDEVYYDLQSFSADQELRDSMLLVHRYSLEPFMTPRQFFYPRVVIKFYHTMKSRRESTPTTLNFSIDGRVGILRALDIAAIFNLSVVLANSTAYRQWPHPLPREMVRLLSGTTTTGSVLFRRHLPPRMLLIDHILWSNLFPLQHTVQRRGAILEALYRISKGYWFSPTELIMTPLFHFEDKVHCKSLPRAESTPLLFLRLLCQVLEHIGFPDEPRLEHHHDCEANLTVNQWQLMPRSFPLPAEDQPATDISVKEQPPLVEHIGEPQAPVPSIPTSPPGPNTAPTDGAVASTTVPPP